MELLSSTDNMPVVDLQSGVELGLPAIKRMTLPPPLSRRILSPEPYLWV